MSVTPEEQARLQVAAQAELRGSKCAGCGAVKRFPSETCFCGGVGAGGVSLPSARPDRSDLNPAAVAALSGTDALAAIRRRLVPS